MWGCDALGWPNKILRWVISIETWRRRRSTAKSVRAFPTRLPGEGLGRRIDIAGPKPGSGSSDMHIACAMRVSSQKSVDTRSASIARRAQRANRCIESGVGDEVYSLRWWHERFRVPLAGLLTEPAPSHEESATMAVGQARHNTQYDAVQDEGTRCVKLTVHAGLNADR